MASEIGKKCRGREENVRGKQRRVKSVAKVFEKCYNKGTEQEIALIRSPWIKETEDESFPLPLSLGVIAEPFLFMKEWLSLR